MGRRGLVSPVICLVTDRRRTAPDARTERDACAALVRLCGDAIAAGVSMIQIREPGLPAAELCALARDVVRAARGSATDVVVNDRADVARAAGARGVHLRADGPPADVVRSMDEDWLIGRSHHGDKPLIGGAALDYVIFGTVFATSSKPDVIACGPDALADATRRLRVPVLAIGGVTPANAADVARTGAGGLAAIGAFLPIGASPDACGAARAVADLRAAFDRGRNSLVE